MINGASELSQLFSILHDGVIVEAFTEETSLLFRVEITYLAQRVAPEFTTFLVRLHQAQDLAFVTWPNEASAAPQTLRSLTQIFIPPLHILSGDCVGARVQVECNQPATSTPHCGGTLSFLATSADVVDERGKHYSLKDLVEIAEAYWKEWSERA